MNYIGMSAKKCEKLTFYLLNDLRVNFNKFSYMYFVKYWNFQGTCKKLPQTCDINWIHQELMELLTFLIFWSKLPLIWPYMECITCVRILQIHVLEIVKKKILLKWSYERTHEEKQNGWLIYVFARTFHTANLDIIYVTK